METNSKGAVEEKRRDGRGIEGEARRTVNPEDTTKRSRNKEWKARKRAVGYSRINIDSSNSFHFASIITNALTRDKRARAKIRRERMKRDDYKFTILFYATYSRDAKDLYFTFLLKLYSLNLNQWIITDISAKYATGNQWIKCEIIT